MLKDEDKVLLVILAVVLFIVVMVMVGYNWGQASMENTFNDLGCSFSVEKAK